MAHYTNIKFHFLRESQGNLYRTTGQQKLSPERFTWVHQICVWYYYESVGSTISVLYVNVHKPIFATCPNYNK